MYKKKVGTKNPTFLIIWNKNKNYKEMRKIKPLNFTILEILRIIFRFRGRKL